MNGFSPDVALGGRRTARAEKRLEETNHGRSGWQAGKCSKAVEGHRTPKTLARESNAPLIAKRRGVRRPSGAVAQRGFC